MTAVSQSLERTIEDLGLIDDWEERYKYLIDLGRALEPLSEAEHDPAFKVRGCASQVWLVPEWRGDRLFFRTDSDALIAKGLAALLVQLYSGQTAAAILSTDARAVFERLQLSGHLSQQRSNGFFSMVERVRALAALGPAGAAPAQ